MHSSRKLGWDILWALLALVSCAGVVTAEGARSTGEGGRRRIVLADRWLLKQLDSDKPDVAALIRESASPDKTWLSAKMPSQVHDVLLAHGLIADPHLGKNAAACAWVGQKDWAYVCRFATPERIGGKALLRFEGLDTLADAYLNGAPIGHFENMFREYAVDVRDRLARPGQENTLVIVFSSPLRYVKNAALPLGDPNAAPHKSLRKCHSDFGSYLGATPHAVKMGVYRDVVLDLPEQAWIDDVSIRTTLAGDHRSATVAARVELAGDPAALQWRLTDPAGNEVKRGRGDASAGVSAIEIPVSEPKLWWPRMEGPQNLYALEVELRSGQRLLDRRRTAFGIREITPVLTDPATGEKRFRFDVNGRPVYWRGGDWVPLEGATHVWQPDRARRLLDLAEQGNMNIVRIWGEGVIPPQSFYDECDRRGICIWQDFMFGYYDHRPGDTEFLDNCRAEIEGTIRRLRNHPAILLWVGGNEQYLWSTGDASPAKREVFERIMPEACKRLDPTRLFHTSSPYGGPTGNWPLEGDWHDYTTINFAPHASVPLFGSEVLRASVPPAATMRRVLGDEDFWPKGFDPAIRKPGQPAWPPAWTYHSTGIATWDRIGAMEQYCDPASAEDLIRVIGTAHGEYLRDRVERQRRGVPDGATDGNRRSWGNIVWRLNDSWPMIYSSVIDYYLEPKIAYYFLRRAYEPVLVSFEKTQDRICVWVVNDSPEHVAGKLVVERVGFDGRVRGKLEKEVATAPGEAKRCLDLTPLGEIGLRSEFLRATVAGRQSTFLLIGERYLHLPEAHLTVRQEKDRIEIATDVFARQVALEFEGLTGAVSEDNYFDLAPGEKRSLRVTGAAGGARLTVRAVNAAPVGVTWTAP
ncbi:MAG: beta-mannosidase [Pirellulales bacterium]